MNTIKLTAIKKVVLTEIVVMALLAACVPSNERARALEGIQRFHKHFNNSEFSQIYDSAGEEARMKISREQFVEDMTAMRKGQGAVIGTQELSTEYHYMDGSSKIRVIPYVKYERGNAREEFVFAHTDGKTELAGFRFLGP